MKKGALISSVAMLLVAVIAMTTASFAWFSSSLTPSVGSFDVTVTTQDALLISADYGTGFKSVLPIADLEAFDITKAVAGGKNDLLLDLTGAKNDVLTNSTLGNSSIKKVDGSVVTALSQNVTDVTDPFSLGFMTTNEPNFKITASPGGFDVNLDQYLGKGGLAVNGDATGAGDLFVNEGKTKHYVMFDLFFKSSLMNVTSPAKLTLDTTTRSVIDGDNPVDTVVTSFTMFDTKATAAKNDDAAVASTEAGYHLPKTLRIAFVSAEVSARGTLATGVTSADVVVVDPYSGATVTDVTGKLPVDAFRPYTTKAATLHDADLTSNTAAVNPEIVSAITNGKTYQVRVYMWIDGNDAESNNFVLGKDTYLKTALSFIGKN